MRFLLLVFLVFAGYALNAQASQPALAIGTDSGYYSSFDGTKIYYRTAGNGNPVLLVHGFIVDGRSWLHASLYQALLENGYRVIIPDLRGNGKSDKPRDSLAYANDAEAKDLAGLMDFLKIKEYAVVGYSRGSIITARLLIRDPRIQLAVMGGMGTDFTNPEWPRRLMFFHALRGDSVPELQNMVAYVKSQKLDRQALTYLQEFQPSATKAQLKNIKQPVLVISGTEDTDNGSAQNLQAFFSRGKYMSVPGDHNHAASTPEFAKAVVSFLKENNY